MGAEPARTEEQPRDPTAATVDAANAGLRPAEALPSNGRVLPAQVLALQRSAGNGAVARAVRSGTLRAARVRIARLVTNPLDEAAGWKDAPGAAAAIDAYVKLSESDRRTAVATSYKKDLVLVLQALSAEDKVHKYRAAIMEIARWVQEEETRASAGMTDDQIATVQKDWMKKQAEDAAKAAAAAKAPVSKTPPPPPTAAEVEAERKKAVESTSIPPAAPSGWDALSAPDQANWTTRATLAITKVVSLAAAKHPELKVKASNFRIAFKDIENRGAGVLAFGESDGAGGERAAIGFAFVSAVELNPAYVMDVVVHELYGHPEYGVYGTEYHLALYDKATGMMPGYVKPAAGTQARRSEIDAYAYQETEMYSVLRSMPYRTAATGKDVGKVPNLDTQTIIDWRVGLMKSQWAPVLIVPVLRGYRMRLVIDPRITGAALNVFDAGVAKTFDAATFAKVKK